MEWVSNIYFDGDLQKAKDALSHTQGKLSELCQFDSLPLIDGADDEPEHETQMVDGEVHSFWSICDPNTESEPIPLPSWMRAGIDVTILKWRQLFIKWSEKLAKRELELKHNLPPMQQKAYDDFLANDKQSIVFDKTKKKIVANVSEKSVQKLKKHCLLLVIHMSDDAAKLAITTGCGKLWKLKLLEHSKPICDDIPSEVDHFAGLKSHCAVLNVLL